MTIIDYIRQVKDKFFDELPLNELDLVLINEIGYLPFESGYEGPIKSWGDTFFSDEKTDYDFIMTKDRVELFQLVATSQRFAGMAISHYVNEVNPEFEKQFAAMVFSLPSINHKQVVFRGTDDTLIGWKEDFKLTYMSEIPAQRSAVTYLKTFLEEVAQPVYVTGHSKGGNLAVYASSLQTSELQEKIQAIYMLDAPGFRTTFLESSGYQAIHPKLVVIRPKESIVGVMLELDVDPLTVDAKGLSMAQHTVTTWQTMEQGHFVSAKQTDFSVNLGKTFDQWIVDLNNAELKLIFDLLFDTLMDKGIDSLNDLSEPQVIGKVMSVVATINKQDRSKREILQKSFWALISTFAKNSNISFKPQFNLDELWEKVTKSRTK